MSKQPVPEQHHLYRRDAFVVRIWWEATENDLPIWRGWVQHARSREVRYFSRLADLIAFLERHAGTLTVLQTPPSTHTDSLTR